MVVMEQLTGIYVFGRSTRLNHVTSTPGLIRMYDSSNCTYFCINRRYFSACEVRCAISLEDIALTTLLAYYNCEELILTMERGKHFNNQLGGRYLFECPAAALKFEILYLVQVGEDLCAPMLVEIAVYQLYEYLILCLEVGYRNRKQGGSWSFGHLLLSSGAP